MDTSARNQLKGTVRSVTIGAVMAEVIVDVNGIEIVAAITKDSAERLSPGAGHVGGRDHQSDRRHDRYRVVHGVAERYSGRFTITLVALTVATASIPGFNPS